MRAPVALLAIASSIFACSELETPSRTMSIRAPGRIMQALSVFTELGADAQLVPKGASPLAKVALTRAADGVSFSGFIAAEPGDYTLELAFSGLHSSSTERLFLGRWVSDAFTVVRGQTAMPNFSSPLDPIGRPSDGGDVDNDRFGVIDEILWNTDPTDSDSDGDGTTDGFDCSPADGNDEFLIAGTIEDCDGDGSRRPDLPIGTPGDDCNDRDSTISPRAMDQCGDGADTDCNPATCEGDTGGGPAIMLLEPTAGSTVGCHRRIAARITDGAGVQSAEVLFLDDSEPPQTIESVDMGVQPGDVYATGLLDRATTVWLEPGPQKLRVVASSNRGAASEYNFSINFDLGVPQTTITPAMIGEQTTPFMVTVNANATRGIASIALKMTRVPVGGSVVRSTEVEVGRVEDENSATFTIDPTTLMPGEYAIYPIVIDNVGNELKPDDDFSLDGATTEADYLCLFDPGGAVPLRTLIVPGAPEPGFERAKMRDHLDAAIAAAAARDPNAQLVEIRGDGIQPDGYIALDRGSPEGDGKWWLYTFFNFTDDRRVEVQWFSAAYDVTNPVVAVTEMDPFGFSYSPIKMVPALADSDLVVQAYSMSMGCPALTGVDSDIIRYESDEPFTTADVVHIDVGEMYWKANALPPVTEIWMCM